MPLVGGAAVPGQRFRKIVFDALAFFIQHAQVVLRVGVAGLGQRLPFLERGLEIALAVGRDAGRQVGMRRRRK